MRNLAIFSTLLAFCAQPAAAQDIRSEAWVEGIARVVDGDSVYIDDQLVRLYGIDAPEQEQLCYTGNLNHACGAEATNYLSDMIYDQHVKCRVESRDIYDRVIGTCIWNGRNINEIMVLTGNAIAWRNQSDKYLGIEQQAIAGRAGIWNTDFLPPEEWRQIQKDQSEKVMQFEYSRPNAGRPRTTPTFDAN